MPYLERSDLQGQLNSRFAVGPSGPYNGIDIESRREEPASNIGQDEIQIARESRTRDVERSKEQR